MKIRVLLLGLALAGCATPAEQSAQWQAEIDRMIQTYGPACDKLGYKRDDDKWRDCVLRLSARDERHYRNPRMTTCFGSRALLTCNSF